MGERRSGFTLVETVIVVALMALVATVVALAITTMLRASAPTTQRVDDARSMQGLTAWFPRDVASTPARAANITSLPGSLACVGSETAVGDNLLELRSTISGVTHVVAYRLEADGGADVVRRYACSDASGPFDDTTSKTVTAELASAFSVSASPPYDLVAIDLQTVDGDAIRVEATPRNPDETLPPTTPAPPPSAPAPCSVTFVAPSYGPVGRYAGPPAEKLLTSVDLELTVTGDTCSTLTVVYDTGYVFDEENPIVVAGTTGTATIPQGDLTPSTPQWTQGLKTLRVWNNGMELAGATATLEVSP